MTRLEIYIDHEYEPETWSYDFENDTAALLAATAFAVKNKITKCITYKVKEKKNET